MDALPKAVIVCGGREFTDYHRIHSALERINPAIVISGCARGADQIAKDWALKVPGMVFIGLPANWVKHGKAAGPIRNRGMLEELLTYRDTHDIMVVAFPGGVGTANMCHIANKAGVKVEKC